MNINQIFAPSFITIVQDLLDQKCVSGAAVTRSDLCRYLDLSVPDSGDPKKNEHLALVLDGVVGSLITLDVIPGFESRKGPGGGIGRVGEKRAPVAKEKEVSTVKEATYPEGFLSRLESTLNTMCVDAKCFRRKDIAQQMGMPGSDTEALISSAIKDLSGLGARFESQRGIGGGVRRRAVALTVADVVQYDEVTEETSTEVDVSVQTEIDQLETEYFPDLPGFDSSTLPDPVVDEHIEAAIARMSSAQNESEETTDAEEAANVVSVDKASKKKTSKKNKKGPDAAAA